MKFAPTVNRPGRAAAAALGLGFAATSCLDVVDVVQPLEVPAGAKFEVAALLCAQADASTVARGPAYGLFAISLPEGAEVKGISFEGPGRGKFHPWEGEGPGPGEPGYR